MMLLVWQPEALQVKPVVRWSVIWTNPDVRDRRTYVWGREESKIPQGVVVNLSFAAHSTNSLTQKAEADLVPDDGKKTT